jgi:hypothetical protein
MRTGACIIAFAFLSPLALVTSAKSETDPCGNGAQRDQKEVELRATVADTLKEIQSGDASSFLSRVDDRGIWVSGDLITVAELKRQFRNKEELYCLLFSSSCLSSAKLPGDLQAQWKLSYAEWLTKNGSPKVEIDMGYGGDEEPCTANVSIRASDKPQSMPETFELGFDFRGGRWLFRRTPAYPPGIASRTSRHLGDLTWQ